MILKAFLLLTLISFSYASGTVTSKSEISVILDNYLSQTPDAPRSENIIAFMKDENFYPVFMKIFILSPDAASFICNKIKELLDPQKLFKSFSHATETETASVRKSIDDGFSGLVKYEIDNFNIKETPTFLRYVLLALQTFINVSKDNQCQTITSVEEVVASLIAILRLIPFFSQLKDKNECKIIQLLSLISNEPNDISARDFADLRKQIYGEIGIKFSEESNSNNNKEQPDTINDENQPDAINDKKQPNNKYLKWIMGGIILIVILLVIGISLKLFVFKKK